MPFNIQRLPIQQIAYFVEDVVASAQHHHALFGSGPYFVAENIELSTCLHRGQPATLLHTSAYGQWGEIMVEFCQQNNPGPSVFRDLYPTGGGLHHVAIVVENLQAALHAYAQEGYPTALYAELSTGQAYAMVDCIKTLGHFIELYEPNEVVTQVYELVRTAAQDWDGRDIIRSFAL